MRPKSKKLLANLVEAVEAARAAEAAMAAVAAAMALVEGTAWVGAARAVSEAAEAAAARAVARKTAAAAAAKAVRATKAAARKERETAANLDAIPFPENFPILNRGCQCTAVALRSGFSAPRTRAWITLRSVGQWRWPWRFDFSIN